MNPLEISELGEIIRKVRRSRGLTLTDLADENISQATISNIERGVPHVHPDKVHYLLRKLEIEDKLSDLMTGEQRELKQIKFRLFMVESLLRVEDVDQADKQLENIVLIDDHPYAAHYYWLKGKILISRRKWKRAERALYNAIRLANQNPYGHQSNIEACSFSELGLCFYYQNDLEGALRFTESGLDAFNEEGERLHTKYTLLRNKAIYLERMGRLAEALKVVQDVWDELPQITEVETVLVFYWLRAELLRRTSLLDEAESYALKGLDLAMINQSYFSMFDLWTVLGSIYMARKSWEEAESCFELALNIKDKIPYKEIMITTCTRLGILYIQMKKWEEARETLDLAIQLGEKYDNAPRLTEALLITGDLYRSQNRIFEAIPFYERAVALAKKHKYKKQEHQAWFRLARCWDGKNEKEFEKCTRNMYIIQRELEPKKVIDIESMG